MMEINSKEGIRDILALMALSDHKSEALEAHYYYSDKKSIDGQEAYNNNELQYIDFDMMEPYK